VLAGLEFPRGSGVLRQNKLGTIINERVCECTAKHSDDGIEIRTI
jgi:hypothetical protein